MQRYGLAHEARHEVRREVGIGGEQLPGERLAVGVGVPEEEQLELVEVVLVGRVHRRVIG